MTHPRIGVRIFAVFALASVFASVHAQAPTFSRITMDPTQTGPTGDLLAIDSARIGGYSLVLSNAINLSRDSSIGSQYYLVSPEGVAERIPLEKVGALARSAGDPTSGQIGLSRISPRGSGAIVRTSDSLYYYYQREGKRFTKLPPISDVIGFVTETKALVSRRAGVSTSSSTDLPGWSEVFEVDTATGQVTPYAIPFAAVYVNRSLVANRWLYYSDGEGRFHYFDVYTKTDTTLAPFEQSAAESAVLDQTGHWMYRLDADVNALALSRTDVRTGVKTVIHRFDNPNGLYVDAAYGDRVTFLTSAPIDPGEVEGAPGFDAYEFDVATGVLSLLSRKSDGTPANNVAPFIGMTYYTQDGSELVYQKAYPIYMGGIPTPPGEWRLAFKQSIRQSVGGAPKGIATTVGGGGNNARVSVTSRNSTAVLYGAANPGIEGWARLVVRDSSARTTGRVVSTSDPYAHSPNDVSDDGRFAVYLGYVDSTGNDRGYHLFVHDSQTDTRRRVTAPFALGVGSRAQGKVDQEGHMWFIADTTDNYTGLSGNWLFRCDMATGTLTPVREVGAVPTIAVYAVGGGRVAHAAGSVATPFVAVTDGFTGQERLRVPAVGSVDADSVVLTTDRKTLGVPAQDGITLYDIPTGTARKTVSPGGKLTPSGEWVVNYSQAVYVPTGAVLNHSPRTAALGAPIGPLIIYGERSGPRFPGSGSIPENDRGSDIARYRVPVATSPVLYGAQASAYRDQLRINAFVLPAGLETAETWIEARVNGGEWERLTFGLFDRAILPSRNGAITLELRGRDALGRTSGT
ncbi:hypothetical protein EON79_05850, partial [bacterium]